MAELILEALRRLEKETIESSERITELENQKRPRPTFIMPKMVFPDRETANLFDYRTRDQLNSMSESDKEDYQQRTKDRQEYINKIQDEQELEELVNKPIIAIDGEV